MSDYVYKPEDCTEVIDLDISDEEFLKIAKAAHRMDITFNHFVNLALHEELKRMKESGELPEEK